MEKKFHFDFITTQEIIKKVGFIDSFKGKWESIQKEENKYLKELKRLATIQSIGSSTRIEGATLTNEEVATLIENLKINKLETRDEQEAIGYYEVLEVILDEYSVIELTESNIFNLHNLLLKFSNKDSSHRGGYKLLSNKVVATYPGGEQKVIFNTTDPFLVKKEMEDLLMWYNGETKRGIMHPLLCIAGFVYEFLSIHPFQDGNGRLSRLLTSLLLLQNDYDFIQYISFENQIEGSKKRYYQVLMNAQQHRGTQKEIINDWVLYFLGSITELINKLEHKYERYKVIGPYLNQRQKELVTFIEQNEPLKISDISEGLKVYSIHSIKKDLQYLYQENVIDKLGRGRGTTYFLLRKDEE
ncbi:MAG: Fic family protein [Saprospiraceae bacterium]